MKTTVCFSLMFLIVSMFLYVSNTTAEYEPHTQWGLPEGAKARLGKGSINDLVYSPDGAHLAVASSIGIWVYEAKTGKELSFLSDSTDADFDIVFSPDGTTLAGISATGVDTVYLWDVATGSLKNTLKGHASVITSIAFSPDGTTLAGGGDFILTVLLSEDVDLFANLADEDVIDVVWLWDVATGTLKNTLEAPAFKASDIVFSPDGTTLAGVLDDSAVSLWDIASGTLEDTLEHTSGVYGAVFSPDGTTLASVDNDGAVNLWDVAAGTLKHTLKGHTDWVNIIVFSLDGTTLASRSWDGPVHVWDVATGTLKNTRKGHIIFSPDGRSFVGVSEDDTLPVEDIAFFEDYTGVVKRVVFSPDGRTLASGYENGAVRVWDVRTGTLKNTLKGHTDEVNSVVFSPDSTTLASASASSSGIDTIVRLWDVRTGALNATLEGHTSTVWSTVFSPDGQTLASASWDDTVRLWDVATGTLKNILEHTRGVRHAVFSPDGLTLASGSDDGAVRVWDVATGTLKNTLKGHEDVLIVPDVFQINPAWSVAFSPNGTTLASGYENGDILLWDVVSGRVKATLEGHTGVVNNVAFSPDGTTLASGSWDDTVHVWDVATGTHKATLEGQMSNISHIVFSPDSRMLASGSWSMGDNALFLSEDDTVVHVWDVASGTLETTFKGHTNVVSSVDFSPDGQTLASGSWDGTVLLWELPSTTGPAVQPQRTVKVLAPGIYWTDTGKIQRANLDGTDIKNIVTGLGDQQSIAVDVAGGKIYWVDWSWSGNGKIQRANLDGTNVEDLVTNGLLGPGHIGVDVAGRKIYWTNDDDGDGDEKIQRANLDGSTVEALVTNEELSSLNGIALDVTRGKVYWTQLYKIQRANLDGTNVEDVFVNSEFGNIFGLALDGAGGKLYWGNPVKGKIQRANLDGSSVEDLVTRGLQAPSGIALDVARGKMYWTDAGTHKIQRANLDGSNIEDLVTGLEVPLGIGIFSPGVPLTAAAESETRRADVNDDGVVNIQDLVRVASRFGETGENAADVNGDGVVNIQDLVKVAGAFGGAAAAPAAYTLSLLTPETVQQWLTAAEQMRPTDAVSLRGIAVLEHLLAVLTPKETALLANYPNPFNPETWIPYQLSEPADVTLTIYATNGQVVRTLALGHQPAGIYQSRSRAAYWDSRNALGEPVASGVYFYTLTTGEFTATRKMLITK